MSKERARSRIVPLPDDSTLSGPFYKKVWYLPSKGKNYHHRTNGPAIIWYDGSETWCQHDRLHRVGGPALIYKGKVKMWAINGLLHRTNGPAIEFESRDNSNNWYYEGVPIKGLENNEIISWVEYLEAKKRKTSKI